MEKKIGVAHKRLLTLLYEIHADGIKANSEGVSKIAIGLPDEETSPLMDKPYFALCPSISKKKIKSRLNYLYRYGYISLKYDERMDDYAYLVSAKGEPYIDRDLLEKKRIKSQKKPNIIIEEEK